MELEDKSQGQQSQFLPPTLRILVGGRGGFKDVIVLDTLSNSGP